MLDLPGLRELLTQLHRRELSLVEVETPTRLAVRLLAAVRLRRDVHVRGRHAERRAARGGAVARPRPAARAARPGGAARPDRRGRARRRSRPTSSTAPSARAPTTRDELARRAAPRRRPDRARGARARPRRASTPRRCSPSWRASAAPCGCASAARSAGSPPTTPASTATRSAPCRPAGCRRRSSPTSPDALARLVRRYARTHGPFTTERAARRATASTSSAVAARAGARRRRWSAASCGRAAREREWCDADVLRRLRRASLAVAAQGDRAGRPARAGGASCRRWQGVDRHPRGGRRRRPAARGARAAAGPRAARRGLGARRAAAAHRRATRRRGWTSCARAASSCGSAPARSGAARGRVALYFREDAEADRPAAGASATGAPSEPAHELLRERLGRGAVLLHRPAGRASTLAPEELQEALWDLVWAGEVTNDAFAPLRAPRLTLARAQRATLGAAAARPPLRRAPRAARRRRCRAAGR